MKERFKKLILGTVQFGLDYGINNFRGKVPRYEAEKILEQAYKKGIRHLDTADGYGDAYAVIRSYHNKNNSFGILTKFTWNQTKDVKVREILYKLKVKTIDCYSFHRYLDIENGCAVEMVKELKREGLIEKIGASVYSNSELSYCIDLDFIDVIQIPFNVLDNVSQKDGLLEKAKEKNKQIHVRSIFLQGLLFMPYMDYPEKLRPLQKYIQRLEKIARDNCLSINELALLYPLLINGIDAVLFGVDTLDQLNRNIEAVMRDVDGDALIEAVNEVVVDEKELLLPTNW